MQTRRCIFKAKSQGSKQYKSVLLFRAPIPFSRQTYSRDHGALNAKENCASAKDFGLQLCLRRRYAIQLVREFWRASFLCLATKLHYIAVAKHLRPTNP